MHVWKLRVASWTAAVALGAALFGFAGNYLIRRSTLEQRISSAEIGSALAHVAPIEQKADGVVEYGTVLAALVKYDWNATPPPTPAPPHGPPLPARPPTAAELVRILLVNADTADEGRSQAVIEYRATAQVAAKSSPRVKHVGDALEAPHEGISIAAILPEGVWFAFADGVRQQEFIAPSEFRRRLDLASLATTDGETGTGQPAGPRARAQPPAHTVDLGDGTFLIGTEDAAEWSASYQQYLAEIGTDRHRDPATGKCDGIVLTSVPAGSALAAHGAKEGDVILSINGHPVSSVHEALSWAKQHQDENTEWVVELERKGKLVTLTYRLPQQP